MNLILAKLKGSKKSPAFLKNLIAKLPTLKEQAMNERQSAGSAGLFGKPK